MGFYCHGCEVQHEAIELLKELLRELLIIRHKQPCLKTANGIPMGMGNAKERRVRKSLEALRKLGISFEPSDIKT